MERLDCNLVEHNIFFISSEWCLGEENSALQRG
jgi:hypothetical protein